ncbi:MAG: hypothetical protein DYG89_53715 [Caldilinea sp. CFX5]|nr:hypothetical protein [Caldilinea sp. CFX5]
MQEVLGEAAAPDLSAEQPDREALLVYIEAELAGHNAAQVHPEVALALADSALWRQEYVALKKFLAWEAQGPLAQPPRPPCFDFSYLPASAPVVEPTTALPPLSWYWAQLGYLVVELSDAVQRLLQPPQRQPAHSFVRAGQGEQNEVHFTLENQLADLNLRLTIAREPATGDQCQVIVEAEIPSRGGWPNLADTIVNLKEADTVVQSCLTDAFGKAVFPAVALSQLPALQVEVIPGLPPPAPDHR